MCSSGTSPLVCCRHRDIKLTNNAKVKGVEKLLDYVLDLKKVKSTPFSEFVRNASSKEKRKFFDKVIKETVAVQKAMIEESKVCN